MGWAEDYQRDQEKQQRELRLRVASDLNYDPDTASRIFGVAAKTKLPTDVVAADLDGLEAQLKRKSFNFDNYTDEKNGSPIFNKFAAEDPYNYAVLERNRKSMNAFERAVDPIALGWKAGWGTTRIADIQDRRIKGDKREGDEAQLKELRKLTAGGNFGADNTFSKFLVGAANQLPIMGTIAYESLDETLGGAIAGGAAGLALGPEAVIPTAAIGARVGAVTGSTMETFKLERGLAYDQYLQLGINEKDALTMANMVGAVNAPLELIGLRGLTKRIPGVRRLTGDATGEAVSRIFNKPRFRDAFARTALQYGEGVAAEIVTEILQESATIAGQEYLKSRQRAAGDDRPEMAAMTEDEFYDSLGDIATQTMYGVGLIGAAGPIMGLRADSKRAAAARQQQQAWAALGEAVEEGSKNKADGTVWGEFVKRIKAEGPLKEVRIDAEGFRKYWQSKQISPEDAAKQLGIDLGEQETHDVDVVIPLDVFVDKIAPTEHMGGLMKDFRAREGDMTMREAEAWYKDKDKHIERVEAALKAEFDRTTETEITEDLTGQLVASGYNPQAASKMAQLHAAITTVTAARAGIDPMQLYRERLIGVRKQLPDALAGESVDMTMDPILDRIRNKDFPKQREIFGESLIDMFRRVGGIQDQGGELSSRDFGKQFVGVIRKNGRTIDEMAEIAFDEGYIAAHDESLLMEAIDREASGTLVFGNNTKVNTELQTLLAELEQAAEFLDQEGIDLNELSNPEVRTILSGIKTLEQSGDNELADLRAMIEQQSKNDPTLLSKLMLQMPKVAEKQDFSSVTFTDKFVDERGKKGTIKQNAQKAYNEAVKQRNLLKRLLDCVNG